VPRRFEAGRRAVCAAAVLRVAYSPLLNTTAVEVVGR